MARMIHVEQQRVFLVPAAQTSEKGRAMVGLILDICSPDDDAPDFSLFDVVEMVTQLIALLPF